MNTNQHIWAPTDAELEAMYDEYTKHESQIWEDLGVYRTEYEKRLASLNKSHEVARDNLYEKYKGLNEQYKEKSQIQTVKESQSLYEKFLRQYANSLDRALDRRRDD